MSVSTVRVLAVGAAVLVAGAASLLVTESGISVIDAVYVTLMTVTTIGYGDTP